MGRFPSWKCLGKQPMKKKGVKRFWRWSSGKGCPWMYGDLLDHLQFSVAPPPQSLLSQIIGAERNTSTAPEVRNLTEFRASTENSLVFCMPEIPQTLGPERNCDDKFFGGREFRRNRAKNWAKFWAKFWGCFRALLAAQNYAKEKFSQNSPQFVAPCPRMKCLKISSPWASGVGGCQCISRKILAITQVFTGAAPLTRQQLDQHQ